MLEKIIESTISQFPPTSGDDLLGFEMDFVALFDDEKFRTAEVSISKNSQSIINIEQNMPTNFTRCAATTSLGRVLGSPRQRSRTTRTPGGVFSRVAASRYDHIF
jgi:hypothetical protein